MSKLETAVGQALSSVPNNVTGLYYLPGSQGVRAGRNPNTGRILPATTIGAIAPGRGNQYNGMVSPLIDPNVPRSLMAEPGIQLGPRFGFAWDVTGNGKTAVRGGFGLFYNRMSHGVVLTDFSVQSPIVDRPTVYFGAISALTSSTGFTFPSNVAGLDPNAKVPRVMNFSLTVQRDIGFNTIIDIGYVGSLGRNGTKEDIITWRRQRGEKSGSR